MKKFGLYFDTTHDLSIGLYDPTEKVWIKRLQIEHRKCSQIFHSTLYEFLKEEGLTLKDLHESCVCSGPGSYTGIRLAFGAGETFAWSGLPTSYFYHHEVPALLGEKRGQWASFAYKGEVYVHSWDLEKKSLNSDHWKKDQLLGVQEFQQDFDSSLPLFCYSSDALSSFLPQEATPILMSSLLERAPRDLFPKLKASKTRPPFYFRPGEQEFQVPQTLR